MKAFVSTPIASLILAISLSAIVGKAAAADSAKETTKTPKKEAPFTPGGVWRRGDMQRPQPVVVTPPTASTQESPGQPSSDAIVLFNGRDFSMWRRQVPGNDPNPTSQVPQWKIENGYMEVVPKTGSIVTKDKFADCQIHIEWATPTEVKGSSQGRGNSGILISGHPEIQVLDSYQNVTYADGSAAALYGLYPPLVNASRKPGEWQTYDIFYFAPRFDAQQKLIQPARYTVIHNGILVHHNVEVPGTTVECTIGLQNHTNPVRYRNIWIRKLKAYDEK